MGKLLLRFFLLLLITTVFLLIYLSYFGIETDKFDKLIKNRANEVNQHIKLEFQKTKIHLNTRELNLVLKLQNPKIMIKNNEINFSKIDLFLSLKSFFSSDFLLKRAEIAFIKNDIKDITKITNIFLPRIINKQFNKIFEEGNLEGEFIIPFNPDGTIGKDYGFSGKISDASIHLTKEFSIKNLTTEIKHEKSNEFKAIITKGLLFDLDLSGSSFNLKNHENIRKVETLLHTNGKINFSQIKKISSLFGLEINYFKAIDGQADLKTNIDFDIDKKFKIKNLSYSINGVVKQLDLETQEKKIIKKYLSSYSPKIRLLDIKLDLKPTIKNKHFHKLKLEGNLCFDETSCHFIDITHRYYYKEKKNKIFGGISLTGTEIIIPRFNYKKIKDVTASLDFDVDFVSDNYYFIHKLYYEDRIGTKVSGIWLNQIELNNKLELLRFGINDLNNVVVKTYSDPNNHTILNNDFSIDMSDKIIVSGKLFDAQVLLKTIFKKTERKTFSKNFNSEIKINFDKTLTGTNDDLSNFAVVASINKGSYDKLSLKGNFSENEIVEMSIYQVDIDKKILHVVSDRARPFVKNFDFIKGFEGGKLEYESIIYKKGSNSKLLITDFKVSKVPALAKLLTLASLQGIADTLSGEGIRFESFEMKSNSEANVLNIEDALAMGPAISILLEGYVDKGKIVSLKGTLVPATKLNSIIASIPLVGDILVGKKAGEGVVGVSFKMKGPPKDIKTTVNPIKTLTPRFIVRTLEKIKKKKAK